jgi:hypothetical protein
MPRASDSLPYSKPIDILAQFNDISDEFVAWSSRKDISEVALGYCDV